MASGQHSPSAVEFTGYYNITDEEAGGNADVLRTTPAAPPELTFDEFWEFRAKAVAFFEPIVKEYWRDKQRPVASSEAEPFVRDELVDRTLYIDVYPGFTLINAEVLQRLQGELLVAHRLWRLALIGEDPETTIMVYPDVIRVGDSPAEADVDAEIEKLAARVEKMREIREGPDRRQLKFLKRGVADAVAQFGDKPFQVVAVFDNCSGDNSRLTVFLLIPGNDSHALEIQSPIGPEHVWVGSAFGVDMNGKIISEVEIPEEAAFCVIRGHPPSEYRGALYVADLERGVRHVFDVKSEDIVTDDELWEMFDGAKGAPREL